jgi:hypothetical protein
MSSTGKIAERPDGLKQGGGMAKREDEREYPIQALQDGIAVMEALMVDFLPWSINDIARHTGLSRDKVFRILWNFKTHGWVDQVDENGRQCYRLGYPILTLFPRVYRVMWEDQYGNGNKQ